MGGNLDPMSVGGGTVPETMKVLLEMRVHGSWVPWVLCKAYLDAGSSGAGLESIAVKISIVLGPVCSLGGFTM